MLRFPAHIGGVLMACPSCGNTFHSDFKLGGTGKSVPQEVITKVFEMPSGLLNDVLLAFFIFDLNSELFELAMKIRSKNNFLED